MPAYSNIVTKITPLFSWTENFRQKPYLFTSCKLILLGDFYFLASSNCESAERDETITTWKNVTVLCE